MTEEDEREKLINETSSKIMRMLYEDGLSFSEGIMALVQVIATSSAVCQITEGSDGQQLLDCVCSALKDLFKIKYEEFNHPDTINDIKNGLLATKLIMKYFGKDKEC